MSDEDHVNSQIHDSVANVVTLLTGQAPSQSMSMLDTVLLETIGMAMHNAVTRQQQAHVTSSAAVTATCARILQSPFPKPPPPPPPTPPVLTPPESPKNPSKAGPPITVNTSNSAEAALLQLIKLEKNGSTQTDKDNQKDRKDTETKAGKKAGPKADNKADAPPRDKGAQQPTADASPENHGAQTS